MNASERQGAERCNIVRQEDKAVDRQLCMRSWRGTIDCGCGCSELIHLLSFFPLAQTSLRCPHPPYTCLRYAEISPVHVDAFESMLPGRVLTVGLALTTNSTHITTSLHHILLPRLFCTAVRELPPAACIFLQRTFKRSRCKHSGAQLSNFRARTPGAQ
jgi:hypothetical protein